MVKKSAENSEIVAAVMTAFDADVDISAYWDDDHKSSVGIMVAKSKPSPGFSSYGTVGLSDFPVYQGKKKLPVRVELLGVSGARAKSFPNILATAAFNVINSRWMICPEMIFPDVVKMYEPSKVMQHLFFVSPYPWEGKLNTLKLATKTVAWLLAVPISDAEYAFARDQGADKLDELLAKHEIEYFDINRKSVV